MSEGTSAVHADTDESAPPGICASRHPLLEDLQCQRLKGHPGQHGAAVESSSTELTMEWSGSAGSDAG